jgi:Mo-dependent nitrogenase C-terminus
MTRLNRNFPLDDILQPVRQWLESIEIHNPRLARLLCRIIPAQCPFERDIKIFGRTLFHQIPRAVEAPDFRHGCKAQAILIAVKK